MAALLAAEVPHEVVRYRHDPRNKSFGAEAESELAAVQGGAAEQVYKTLIIALPKGLGVAVLPVHSTLSLKAAPRRSATKPPRNAPPGTSSEAYRHSASANHYRPSSTARRCNGNGCCAAPVAGVGTSPWRRRT
jgi:prolyl-tRNA editing enzyme YbaK/EbsC (Cys-tRNA(Pro) deacylase)